MGFARCGISKVARLTPANGKATKDTALACKCGQTACGMKASGNTARQMATDVSSTDKGIRTSGNGEAIWHTAWGCTTTQISPSMKVSGARISRTAMVWRVGARARALKVVSEMAKKKDMAGTCGQTAQSTTEIGMSTRLTRQASTEVAMDVGSEVSGRTLSFMEQASMFGQMAGNTLANMHSTIRMVLEFSLGLMEDSTKASGTWAGSMVVACTRYEMAFSVAPCGRMESESASVTLLLEETKRFHRVGIKGAQNLPELEQDIARVLKTRA